MNLATAIADIRRQLELIAYREDSFRSDAAKAGGRKRLKPPLCTVGTSCGFSCISKKVNCRKTLRDMFDGDGKAALNALKRVVLKDFGKTRGMGKGGGGGGLSTTGIGSQRVVPDAETRQKMKTIGGNKAKSSSFDLKNATEDQLYAERERLMTEMDGIKTKLRAFYEEVDKAGIEARDKALRELEPWITQKQADIASRIDPDSKSVGRMAISQRKQEVGTKALQEARKKAQIEIEQNPEYQKLKKRESDLLSQVDAIDLELEERTKKQLWGEKGVESFNAKKTKSSKGATSLRKPKKLPTLSQISDYDPLNSRIVERNGRTFIESDIYAPIEIQPLSKVSEQQARQKIIEARRARTGKTGTTPQVSPELLATAKRISSKPFDEYFAEEEQELREAGITDKAEIEQIKQKAKQRWDYYKKLAEQAG